MSIGTVVTTEDGAAQTLELGEEDEGGLSTYGMLVLAAKLMQMLGLPAARFVEDELMPPPASSAAAAATALQPDMVEHFCHMIEGSDFKQRYISLRQVCSTVHTLVSVPAYVTDQLQRCWLIQDDAGMQSQSQLLLIVLMPGRPHTCLSPDSNCNGDNLLWLTADALGARWHHHKTYRKQHRASWDPLCQAPTHHNAFAAVLSKTHAQTLHKLT